MCFVKTWYQIRVKVNDLHVTCRYLPTGTYMYIPIQKLKLVISLYNAKVADIPTDRPNYCSPNHLFTFTCRSIKHPKIPY